jgi:hypothetical protein
MNSGTLLLYIFGGIVVFIGAALSYGMLIAR